MEYYSDYEKLKTALENGTIDEVEQPDLLSVDRIMRETNDPAVAATVAEMIEPEEHPDALFKQAYYRWYRQWLGDAIEKDWRELSRNLLGLHRGYSLDKDWPLQALQNDDEELARRLLRSDHIDPVDGVAAIIKETDLADATVMGWIEFFDRKIDHDKHDRADLLKAAMYRRKKGGSLDLFETILHEHEPELYDWYLGFALDHGLVEAADQLFEAATPVPDVSWANNQLTGGGLNDGYFEVLDRLLDEGLTFDNARFASKLFAQGHIDHGWRALQQTDDRSEIQRRNDEKRERAGNMSRVTYTAPDEEGLHGLLQSPETTREMIEAFIEYVEPDQKITVSDEQSIKQRPKLFGLLISRHLIDNDYEVVRDAARAGVVDEVMGEMSSDGLKRYLRKALENDDEKAANVLEETLRTDRAWEQLRQSAVNESDQPFKHLKRLSDFAHRHDVSFEASAGAPDAEGLVEHFLLAFKERALVYPDDDSFVDYDLGGHARRVAGLVRRAETINLSDTYLGRAVRTGEPGLVEAALPVSDDPDSTAYYEAIQQSNIPNAEAIKDRYSARSDVRERAIKKAVENSRGLSNLLGLRADGQDLSVDAVPRGLRDEGNKRDGFNEAFTDAIDAIAGLEPDEARDRHSDLTTLQKQIHDGDAPNVEKLPEQALLGRELLHEARRSRNPEALRTLIDHYGTDFRALYEPDAWTNWGRYAKQNDHDELLRTVFEEAPGPARAELIGRVVDYDRADELSDCDYPPVKTVAQAVRGIGDTDNYDQQVSRAKMLFDRAEFDDAQQSRLFERLLEYPNRTVLSHALSNMPEARIDNEAVLHDVLQGSSIGGSQGDSLFEEVIERIDTPIIDEDHLNQTYDDSFVNYALSGAEISPEHAMMLAEQIKRPYQPDTKRHSNIIDRYNRYEGFYQTLLKRELISHPEEFVAVLVDRQDTGTRDAIDIDALFDVIEPRVQDYYNEMGESMVPIEALEQLVERGADPLPEDGELIKNALNNGSLQYAQDLAGLANRTIDGVIGIEEAARAAADRALDAAVEFVEKGADPDQFADNLMLRVARDRNDDIDKTTNLLQDMHKLGFKPDGTKADIRKVVETGEPELIRTLGEMGLNYHSKALYEAAQNESAETIKALLEHYNPSERVLSKALNDALEKSNDAEVASILSDRGGDPMHIDLDRDAFDKALNIDRATSANDPYRDVARIIDLGGDPRAHPGVLKTVIKDGQSATLVVLTEAVEYDPEVLGNHLGLAIDNQQKAMLEQLIDAGADPTVDQQRPVLRAAQAHAGGCLKLLLKHDDVDLHEREATPFAAALQGAADTPSATSTFETLMDHGCTFDQPVDTDRISSFEHEECAGSTRDILQIMAAQHLLCTPEGAEFFQWLCEGGRPGKGFLKWFLHETNKQERSEIYPTVEPCLSRRQRMRIEQDTSLNIGKLA